VVDEFII